MTAMTEKIAEARRLADEGLGAEDIHVRTGLSLQTAKQIVIEQWHRRHHAAQRVQT